MNANESTTGEQVVREQCPGMTLRHYFAARAMQGLLAAGNAMPLESFSGSGSGKGEAVAALLQIVAYNVPIWDGLIDDARAAIAESEAL